MAIQRISPDDFFDIYDSGDPLIPHRKELKDELMDQLVRAPLPGIEDIEMFSGLVKLVHEELTAFGTSGGTRLNDGEFETVLRATSRVGKRCNIDFPNLPFRNFTGFHAYWKKHDMEGSWAARREYVNDMLLSVEDAIYEMRERFWDETLADPISPHGATGWAIIDSEITQMRRHFAIASTEQDHAAVGNACVRILEMLAKLAFDPSKYAVDGRPLPSKSQTKIRLELIVRKELPEKDFEHAFKLSSACIELAQRVKHSPAPSRRETGISADSVILLVNIIRRISQEP